MSANNTCLGFRFLKTMPIGKVRGIVRNLFRGLYFKRRAYSTDATKTLVFPQARTHIQDTGKRDSLNLGPHTSAAVVAFQLSEGLTPNGEVGPQTAEGLGISQ